MSETAPHHGSTLKQMVRVSMERVSWPALVVSGRLRFLDPRPLRFTGAYRSHKLAMVAAESKALAGYDHDEIAHVSFEKMCAVAPWDYPVIYWLDKLLPGTDVLLDAGGHMGTKYRAFKRFLEYPPAYRWIVYDMPAIVGAGRSRAEEDGLHDLGFIDHLDDCPPVDIFLGSGLMQYLDVPLAKLLARLPNPPRHILLNKVAFHKHGPLFTLERIGKAMVPYQMRDKRDFMTEMAMLGYEIVDQWDIPSLSSAIDTHPELGKSTSGGFYFRLREHAVQTTPAI